MAINVVQIAHEEFGFPRLITTYTIVICCATLFCRPPVPEASLSLVPHSWSRDSSAGWPTAYAEKLSKCINVAWRIMLRYSALRAKSSKTGISFFSHISIDAAFGPD
jgi:hypothetical protein